MTIKLQAKPNRKVALWAPDAPQASQVAKRLGVRGLRPIASALKVDNYYYLDLASLSYAVSDALKSKGNDALNSFQASELCNMLRIATGGEVYGSHKKQDLIAVLAKLLQS